MVLRGIVKGRYGTASQNLLLVGKLIQERAGLPEFFPGTLNVEIPSRYFVEPEFVITKQEYADVEELRFRRCWIHGLECWIMRPETHEPNDAHVLEIVSQHRLRDYLGVNDGDEVEVVVR